MSWDKGIGPMTWRGTYVIDPLAAETDKQRTERKKAARKEFPGWAHVISTVLTFALVAAVFAAAGTVLGNSLDADVRDIDIHLPSLSGERAEPEESAR